MPARRRSTIRGPDPPRVDDYLRQPEPGATTGVGLLHKPGIPLSVHLIACQTAERPELHESPSSVYLNLPNASQIYVFSQPQHHQQQWMSGRGSCVQLL